MVNWFKRGDKPFPIFCLVGPTASGKTDISLLIAQKLGQVEILYADSMAIYKYLDIGTAKPSLNQRRSVPHHFIDILEPNQRWSSYHFRTEAIRCLGECLNRQSLPIVVGGTGFYLQSLYQPSVVHGCPVHPCLRIVLDRFSNSQLFAQVQAVDPPRAHRIGKNDRKRLVRALEIYYQTGKPPSFFDKKKNDQSQPYQFYLAGLYYDRSKLQSRIFRRTHDMLNHGLIEETQRVLNRGFPENSPAFNNFTYRPVIQYLQGKITHHQMEQHIIIGTNQYLKRQLTWFRKAPIYWVQTEGKNLDIISEELIQWYIKKRGR